MIKYIIAKRQSGSARQLAELLNAQVKRRVQHNALLSEHFFMGYQKLPDNYEGLSEEYTLAREFYTSNKLQQRTIIKNHGLKTLESFTDPELMNGPCVIRPMRHSRGINYIVTDNKLLLTENHYATPIFMKTHEYRLITLYGNPLLLLKKDCQIDPSQPWNHANGSRFITINPPSSLLYTRTNFFEEIDKPETKRFLSLFSILGIDILYNNNTREWAVCEFNINPSLKIPENLRKIALWIETNC